MRRGSRHGVELFIREDGAYTTVAAAVSIIVILTLLFSAVSAVWTLSRSGDVQASADATALAGANVVSSYHTAATVVDASILSMGLAGMSMAGAGLVGLLVPGAQAAAAETINAGIRMLKLRNEFATSASQGLSTLETSLPYLVAANAARTCAAQGEGDAATTGTALAVPSSSDSSFPALEGDGISTDVLEQTASELEEAATELSRVAEETARLKEAAWIADCGRDGYNMQERAASLTELSASENPDVSSSIIWEPAIALDRARSYYRWRLEHVTVEGAGVEAEADAAARQAFYSFALEQLERACFEEVDGGIEFDVPLLPRNTDEVRATTLYTDATWPSTYEGGVLVLHYGDACPGATGATGSFLALAAIDEGTAGECTICQFSVGDVGKTPAASTSIENGFEYHLREFTLALEEYAASRAHELELERATQDEATAAADAFEDALGTLAAKRPRIAPPGRYGCVAVAVAGERTTSEQLSQAFVPGAQLAARGAMSAAALAPDAATRDNNVLSQFFSTLSSRAGGSGATGLIEDVMGLWGSLLISYGEASDGLGEVMDGLLGDLELAGAGPIATWLGERIDAAVGALGLEPVDLSLRKPVLVDSSKVLARSGDDDLAHLQEGLRSIPLGSTDPVAIAEALQYEIGNRIGSATFTIARIPLPGGGSIPLTIKVSDLIGAGGTS